MTSANRRVWLTTAAVGSALALVALTVLVATGSIGFVDQFAVDHLMPATRPHSGVNPSGWSLTPSLDTSYHGPDRALSLVAHLIALLGSPIVAGLGVLALCGLLWRQGRRNAAAIWLGAFVSANLIEVVGKLTIERPSLDRSVGSHVLSLHAYDSSFPSGHMLRATFLVAMFVWVEPRTRFWAPALCALVGAMLVVDGDHVVTDVVGAILAAVACAALAAIITEPPP